MIAHYPVLYREVLSYIPARARYIYDGTLGHAGHTLSMAEYLSSISNTDYHIYATDIDQQMLDIARRHISQSYYHAYISTYLGNYTDIDDISQQVGGISFDYILLDLGANMQHFKDAERGFSIKLDGKLDMRYDIDSRILHDAYRIINDYREADFCKILEMYGDFSPGNARKIRNHIYSIRKNKKIQTTLELVNILQKLGMSNQKIAVFFQAIRIAVNHEFDNISKFVNMLDKLTHIGSVVSIITFHSGEDTLVKKEFESLIGSGLRHKITKHVITPSDLEVSENSASKSAKLRVIERIE